MKRPLTITLCVLALVLGAALLRYGTLSPCSALKQKFRAEMLAQFLKDDSTSPFEKAGTAIGYALAGPMIDSFVGGLSPIQCFRGLVKLETGRKPFDSTELGLDGSSALGEMPAATQKPDTFIEKWQRSTDVSPIDDTQLETLMVEATQVIESSFGQDIRPMLVLRCKENQTSAFINLHTRPDVDYGSYGSETSRLRLRYDKTPAYYEKLLVSTDGEAVFFRDAVSTINKMMEHQELLVEFLPSGGSPQTVTFNIGGLETEIEPLRAACNWSEVEERNRAKERNRAALVRDMQPVNAARSAAHKLCSSAGHPNDVLTCTIQTGDCERAHSDTTPESRQQLIKCLTAISNGGGAP